MWTVALRADKPAGRDGMPGWQSDGRYPHAGRAAARERARAHRLPAHRAGLDHPAAAQERPGRRRGRRDRRLRQAIPRPARPAKLIALGLSFADVAKALEANNVSRGAGYIERNGEGIVVRAGGRLENIDELGDVVVATRGGVPVRVKDVADVTIGGETRTGSASENGREVVVGTALMLIGGNSRTVAAAVDAKIKRDRAARLPPGIEVKHRAQPHPACRRDHRHRRDEPRRGRAAGHRRAVSAARQFPRRADHRAGDPDRHADDRHRDVAGADQRQPDEPRRARLRPDRRRRRHHHREQPAASGRAAARARPPAVARRSGSQRCAASARR